MEAILEIILQFLFECFLQVVMEILGEIGMQSLAEIFKLREIRNPIGAGFGYFLIGSIAGGISLLIIKKSFIHNSDFRVVNLFVAPVVAGLVAIGLGALRKRRGQHLVRLDRFGYGFIFAFGIALVRFLYATKP